mmetsp:Transcript_22919/g.34750  ORF Transcript_22919/g.34750 Transcript_22919/m.34750 type:complete len:246 (+) Transcript_22919:111-848(+)
MDENNRNIAACAHHNDEKDAPSNDETKSIIRSRVSRIFRVFYSTTAGSKSSSAAEQPAVPPNDDKVMCRLDELYAATKSKLDKLQQARRIGNDMHQQSMNHFLTRQAKAHSRIKSLQAQLVQKPTQDHVDAIHGSSSFEQRQHPSVLSLEIAVCHQMHLWAILLRQESIVLNISRMVETLFEEGRQQEETLRTTTTEQLKQKAKDDTEALSRERQANDNKLCIQIIVIEKLVGHLTLHGQKSTEG